MNYCIFCLIIRFISFTDSSAFYLFIAEAVFVRNSQELVEGPGQDRGTGWLSQILINISEKMINCAA